MRVSSLQAVGWSEGLLPGEELPLDGAQAGSSLLSALGHESIQTTEEYLGVEQDHTDVPCDHLELKLER